MAAHNDFFTWQSLATFAGTTTATTAIVNGIGRVFPEFRYDAALGLLISIGLCVLIAMMDPENGQIIFNRSFATYLIAVVNGFFVFASAAGIAAGGARAAGTPTKTPARRRASPSDSQLDAPAPVSSRFWRYWF